MLVNALYYPWMHFQDDNWVKLALLTWDSVARVRARDVDDRDSDLVRQVKNESNLLLEISPSHADLEDVQGTFSGVLPTLDAGGFKRYRLDQDDWDEHAGLYYHAPESNAGYAAAPRNVTWVYCGAGGTKVLNMLRSEFVWRGLGLPHGPWLGMHPELASVYMAALTDAIARRNRVSPATDDPRMHKAVGALDRLAGLLSGERPAVALDDPDSAFMHVALRAAIKPDRLSGVPVGKLISFRDRHSAELAAFRQHIAGLADELREITTVENAAIAHAHLESLYRSKTKPQLDDLRRALRGLGVESAAGTLSLKVDLNAATGTILGAVATADGQVALAGTAAALTIVPYLAGRAKARRAATASSPVAYLLAASRLT